MAPPPPSPPPSSPPPLPPADLPEEIIEQILLHFPPGEPASLFRAALVCKPWCRLISGSVFRRKFRKLHRTPPTLGFFCNRDVIPVPHFVPTTAFRPRHAELGYGSVMDARHGRVLLNLKEGRGLSVWDPITDEVWKVPVLPFIVTGAFCWTAAVLCSAAAGAGGCDHLDCHRAPFTVVLVASFAWGHDAKVTYIYTYSSNAAAWSKPIWAQRPASFVMPDVRSALVGNTLYFANLLGSSTALKYNMQARQMSWIELPSPWSYRKLSALASTEDGGLWFAIEFECKLYIWSTNDAVEVDTRWEQNRVIELSTLLPDDADLANLDVVTNIYVIGFMDDLSTIFVSMGNAAYAIDPKTFKVKKVYEGEIETVVPYVSFYTPEDP